MGGEGRLDQVSSPRVVEDSQQVLLPRSSHPLRHLRVASPQPSLYASFSMLVDFIQRQMISWSTIILKVKEQDMFFWLSCLTNNSRTIGCVCVCVYIPTSFAYSVDTTFWSSQPLTNNSGKFIFPTYQRMFCDKFHSCSFLFIVSFPCEEAVGWPILPCALTSTRQEGSSRRARVPSAHVCCPSSFTRILSTLLPSQCFYFLFLFT